MEKPLSPPPRNWFFLAALVGLFSSCASVPSDKISAFSTGITTAKSQASTAFAAVNEVTREEVIDYAASQPHLLDENFYDVLDAAALAQTEATFDALEKYCQSLAALTSPDITKEYKSATVELASQINATGAKVKQLGLTSKAPVLSPGVATAFSELGNLLLKAKATADAKKTMRSADPTVARIFHSMADSLDPIKRTVHANWKKKRTAKDVEFMQETDPAAKRTLAVAFAEMKSKEADQVRVLASLQRSFRALADAHHALAQDSNFQVVAAIAIVKEEANETKDIYDQMKKGVAADTSQKPEKAATPAKTGKNKDQNQTAASPQ